ncbi:MAG: hypothetical protein Q9208_008820 [Pyrenodesmia sp. 3 TL-2023]
MNLSKKCGAIARELHVEIGKLEVNSGGYRWKLLTAVQTIRKARWLKEMQAKLDACTRTLDTLILIRLDTQSLRRSHDLDTLDQGVRDLVLKIERGLFTTERLLAEQTVQIQDHFDRRFDERERGIEIDQARERFQSSLFFPDIEAREDEIVEAFEGTCKWIFDPPMVEGSNESKWHNFRHWLEAGKGVYWISGKPGAGKSTLMKYIVDEPRTAQYLSEWEWDTDLVVVSFFSKNLGTELQKSAVGLLRSLIWQITRHWPDMIELVLRSYGNATRRSQGPLTLTLLPTWTEKRLLRILEDFINEKPATLTLCAFIDGLDEFTGDEELLFNVIRLLSSASGCKVCVSSRPDQKFHREFQGYPQCRVQDLNKKDIGKMVIEKLKPCLEKNRPAETEAINWLVEDLIQQAEGVFLWLSIMINDLTRGSNNGDRIDELRERLRVTPSTIHGLYRRILGGLDESYSNYALRFFQTLIATHWVNEYDSKRDTLLGLACAEDISWIHITQFDRSYFTSPAFNATFREFRTRISSRCGGLIEIGDHKDDVKETGVVQNCGTVSFIHRTVEEFLTEEYGSAFDRDACLLTAWIPVARAKIALLFLVPLAKPLRKDYELQTGIDGIEPDGEHPPGYQGNSEIRQLSSSVDGSGSDGGPSPTNPHDLRRRQVYDIRRLIACGMTAISFGESSASKAHSSRSLDNDQSDLTACILQILHYMATKDDVVKTLDGRNSYSMKQTLKLVERIFIKSISTDAQLPFQDRMNFAAFWGCESYIRSRWSPETLDEQLEAIFARVVTGLTPTNELTVYTISYLDTVDFLLQERQIPQGKTDSWRSYSASLCRASPWGAFLLQACGPSERPRLSNNKMGRKAAWIQRRLELMEKFLSLGADCNTRLSFSLRLSIKIEQKRPLETLRWTPREDLDFDESPISSKVFVDESPLAYLQALERQENCDNISEISTLLRSEGAVERRRYRFWDGGDTYYRISTSQSKRLDKVLRSTSNTNRLTMYRFDPFPIRDSLTESVGYSDELEKILREIHSTNDRLDWDTLDKEWKLGDSNWLEEND